MKNLVRVLLAMATLAWGHVQAGTQVLGVEIGVSTLDQVRAGLAKQTKVMSGGINKYSAGEMLETEGDSYEIEGLGHVTYIFDSQKKLAAVLMSMDKNRFDAVAEAIGRKHKMSAQQRPFVGNQFARFKAPDAVIELNAPHLSFQMEVRYIRNDLMQKFNTQSAAESEAKTRREADKF